MSTFMQSVGAATPEDANLAKVIEILRDAGGSATSLEVLEKLGTGPIELARVSALGADTGFLRVVKEGTSERLELVES